MCKYFNNQTIILKPGVDKLYIYKENSKVWVGDWMFNIQSSQDKSNALHQVRQLQTHPNLYWML